MKIQVKILQKKEIEDQIDENSGYDEHDELLLSEVKNKFQKKVTIKRTWQLVRSIIMLIRYKISN